MAGPFTAPQLLACFDALDVPYYDGFWTINDMGTLAISTQIASASQSSAKTVILAFLTASIYPDIPAGIYAETAAWLDQYVALGARATDIQNGNVGDLSGVTNLVDKQRQNIADKIRRRIPFYKLHEVMARQQGQSFNSINVGASR